MSGSGSGIERDNNGLIDDLVVYNFIQTRSVERVFRGLERADYMTPEDRDQVYWDQAWQKGQLYMSALRIYSHVMEGLELYRGLSFLHVGSGTGYFSTLVGLIIGSSGINHGIEANPVVVKYASEKLSHFIENSPTLDDFDFCEPKYFTGNGLCLAPLQAPYDRVYCEPLEARTHEEYRNYYKHFIKVGGILVMPLNGELVQIRRVSETDWVSHSLFSVNYSTLRLRARMPTEEEAAELIRPDELCPPKLQVLARSVIRSAMRTGLLRRHPELRDPSAKKSCPCWIPIEDNSDVDSLNVLDRTGRAFDTIGLLNLLLNRGQDSPVSSRHSWSEEVWPDGEREEDELRYDDHSGRSSLRSAVPSLCKEDQRQKLDSCIGEEMASTSSMAPPRYECSDDDGSCSSDSLADDMDAFQQTSCWTECRYWQSPCAGVPRPHHQDDARRRRLSVLMKAGVKELPLPNLLKMFVNFGRCFE